MELRWPIMGCPTLMLTRVCRVAGHLEVLERMNEVSWEDSGALGDTLDSHLRSLEADLKENGMSSVTVVFDSARLKLLIFQTNQWFGRLVTTMVSWLMLMETTYNHEPSFELPAFHNAMLSLFNQWWHGHDDLRIDRVSPSWFYIRISFTFFLNNTPKNLPILPSPLYDNPLSSRTAGCPSDYFWLNTSLPAPADQNSMDTSISSELPSPAPETDIFNSRYSTISDMANTICGTSSSRGGCCYDFLNIFTFYMC